MYQLNIIKKIKKDVKKKTDGERYQNFSKERKKQKGNNMVVNATKTSQTMNNKSLLSIEKSIIVWETTLYNFLSFFNKNLFNLYLYLLPWKGVPKD